MTDETGGKPLFCQGGKLTAATVLLELSKPENVSRIAQYVARRMADADHVTIPTAALTELLAAIGPVVERLSDINDRMFYTRYRNPDEDARHQEANLPLDRLRAAVARVRGE